MSKFQPPMLNGDVCRAATDKQTHKHTDAHTKTYVLSKKQRKPFFYRQVLFFIFYVSFCNSLTERKTVSNSLLIQKKNQSFKCSTWWIIKILVPIEFTFIIVTVVPRREITSENTLCVSRSAMHNNFPCPCVRCCGVNP